MLCDEETLLILGKIDRGALTENQSYHSLPEKKEDGGEED